MCILKGGSGSRWVDRLRVGVGYPVWGFRIEKKSPDFRSPEVGISVIGYCQKCSVMYLNFKK